MFTITETSKEVRGILLKDPWFRYQGFSVSCKTYCRVLSFNLQITKSDTHRAMAVSLVIIDNRFDFRTEVCMSKRTPGYVCAENG